MSSINLVIADDLPYFRESLPAMLQSENDINVIGIANNGAELIELVDQLQPDVVITDVQMPVMNGIQATKELKSRFPAIPVIALTMFDEEYSILDMLEAGATGYISKSTTTSYELIKAVKTVKSGGSFFASSTTLKLSKQIAATDTQLFKSTAASSLSEKEIEIIKLICQEFSSKQIAPVVQLSLRTVEVYRDKIMEKIGAQNTAGIVVYAIRNGFFKP